jgi:hypothetical protein
VLTGAPAPWHGKRRFSRDTEPAMSDKNLTALREGFERFEREGAPIFSLLDPVYAQAVQREGYREAKLRTIARAMPDTLGSNGKPLDLHWDGPDGREHTSGAVILVSNNPYRFRAVGAGTRPHMDTGLLGVAVFEPGRGNGNDPWLQWAVPEFEVRSDSPVRAGLDGESVILEAPIHFSSRPRALTVRIAPTTPVPRPRPACRTLRPTRFIVSSRWQHGAKHDPHTN